MLYDHKIREFTAKTKFQKFIGSTNNVCLFEGLVKGLGIAVEAYQDDSNGYFGWI